MNENDLKNLIDIPKELDNVVLSALERGKKDKFNENKKKNILKRSAIAAAIVLSSTVALGTINPNMVSAFPTINKIFESFNTSLFGESTDKFQDAAQVISKCETDNGVSITLNEALLDDNILMLALTVESDFLKDYTSQNESDFFYLDEDITINGKCVSSTGSKVKIVNDTTGAIILTSDVYDLNLNSSANINLNISSLNRGYDNISGSWKFNFNLDKQPNAKKISINPSIKYTDFEINEVNLISSNLSTTVTLTGNSKDSANRRIFPKILVKDNNDKLFIADMQSGSYSTETGDFTNVYEIKGDLSNSSYIEIIPKNFDDSITEKHKGITYSLLKTTGSDNSQYENTVVSRYPDQDQLNRGYALDKVYYYLAIDKEKEFKPLNELINSKIKVSSSESITIKNIETTNKYTKVFFESKGLYNYSNLGQAVIFDEDMNDTSMLEGALPVAIEDLENGLFSMILGPVDADKKYKIAIPMMPEVNLDNPEWKINISLN